MDVMGRVRLLDGTELSVVTGINVHSHFCVSAMLVPKATAKPVCRALVEAMRRHGIPDAVLTDNGKLFTGRFGVTKTEVLFDRSCRENGVRHLLTAPYLPTTTGKVERLHKTMRAESSAWPGPPLSKSCRPPWIAGCTTTTPSAPIRASMSHRPGASPLPRPGRRSRWWSTTPPAAEPRRCRPRCFRRPHGR